MPVYGRPVTRYPFRRVAGLVAIAGLVAGAVALVVAVETTPRCPVDTVVRTSPAPTWRMAWPSAADYVRTEAAMVADPTFVQAVGAGGYVIVQRTPWGVGDGIQGVSYDVRLPARRTVHLDDARRPGRARPGDPILRMFGVSPYHLVVDGEIADLSVLVTGRGDVVAIFPGNRSLPRRFTTATAPGMPAEPWGGAGTGALGCG
jgi:hypothetical protein